MYQSEIIIKQGVTKNPPWVKINILNNMLIDWLATEIFELELSIWCHYFNNELNAYFYEMFAEHCSGNMAVQLASSKYSFDLMDQQTASERFDQLSIDTIDQKLNKSILDQVKKLPTHKSDYNLAKIKSRETNRRRELAKRSTQRKRQREKGIDPPEGRYLGVDFTLKPSYMDIDEIRKNNEAMAKVLTKDRRKSSTTTFTGHHTLYDYEHGSRQIMATRMLVNNTVPDYKSGWKREGLHDAVRFMVDPVIDAISVKGIVGDGDYRNIKVIQYLQSRQLDYVIRENDDTRIQKIIEDEKLRTKLDDGCGIVVDDNWTMGMGNNEVSSILVIVNRDDELTPLIIAPYSNLTPEQALLLFEERFAIETVYREVYKYLPNTTSKTPQYRAVLYGMTCWFYNLLLNYYQIVVVYASDPDIWDVSLEYIKKLVDQLFADLLRKMLTRG